MLKELVAVTAPYLFAGEAELINSLFAAGLSRLHIRKPGVEQKQVAMLLEQIEPQYIPAVALHQYHGLAPDFGIRHLHYPAACRQQLGMAMLEKRKDEGFRQSSSIHSMGEMEGLWLFDYVFFGPVFNSISKTGYRSSIPHNFMLAEHVVPVYAIGGITAALLPEVCRMNFDGAAVLGSLWQHPDPLSAFKELNNHYLNHHLCL